MASLVAGPQAVDNWSNFEVYKLQRPVGLIRADVHRSPFRGNLEEVCCFTDEISGGAHHMSRAHLLPDAKPCAKALPILLTSSVLLLRC